MVICGMVYYCSNHISLFLNNSFFFQDDPPDPSADHGGLVFDSSHPDRIRKALSKKGPQSFNHVFGNAVFLLHHV